MKLFTLASFIILIAPIAYGQDVLTLDECYTRAQANYPLIRQRDLIQKTKSFSIENASRGSLPRISIGGQATYQSEVTRIPVEMPGIEPLSKDQYKVFGEISQALYHGGIVNQQKQLEDINGVVEEKKLEVELYQLKNRINDLFFGILLLQEQATQSHLVKQDIASGLKKTEAAIANGVALRSAADVLQAEVLRVDQRIIELESNQKSFKEILGLFINQTVSDRTILQTPEMAIGTTAINRPELKLFDFQKQSMDINRALLSARKKPVVDLFVQGGYGRPGLNMLENEFSFYYLGGIRFSWLLSGFYTFNREKQILNLRQQSLDIQKETFLFNTDLTLNQHSAEIVKLQRLIQVDEEIITLRTRVRKTASAQLEQGVISSSDFIREVNAEDQAKQNRVLHATQLLMAQAKYQYTSGN